VICARVAPMQKALIVRLVQQKHTSSVTLAIGDGANDMSMLQESNIGVAIIGTEGQQAALVSDFALAKFHFLRSILYTVIWC
ncbi:MAG: putative phospholipid-translocating P-type ATPase, partial [Streblomastix strix]